MSLPIPLAVRLSTTRTDRVVTRDVRELEFRSVVPGGYASCTITLDRPLSVQPDEIAYFGKLYVYDARTGATVWEGLLEDPGRGASGNGQVWQIAAIGPSAHAHDRTVPLIYVDKSLERWTPVETQACPDGQVRTGNDETIFPGEPSMILSIPNGTPVTSSSYVSRRYLPISLAGQKLARLDYRWDTGRTDTNLHIRAFARDSATWATTFTQIRDDASNTAGGGSTPKVVGTDWTAGKDSCDVRWAYLGTTSQVGDDVTWAALAGLVVQATRYNASGTELLTGASYTANTVTADQVVADLLGRLLTRYDGANATIATNSYAIDQLAYPDGVTAEQVLADLMKLQSGYYWAAWESNSAGKYRFEWSAWPTTVRYEADVTDGFDSPGSALDLYNAVTVRYRGVDGSIRTVRRTQAVAALDNASITREAFLDLGDATGSSANATQAGDQFLAEHASPPNAGRLTIGRPILDVTGGRMVQPWEIRPGTLIRVRGVLPRVDALNASDRDGVTIFRVVGVTYRASTATAELELDSYPRTVAQALARVLERPLTARR